MCIRDRSHTSNRNEVKECNSEIQNLYSKENIMENEIQQYKNEITILKNENNKMIETINYLSKVSELNSSDNFNKVYMYLKELSDNGDQQKMFDSCVIGLSEKRDSNDNTPLLMACYIGYLQLTKSLIEGGCIRDAKNKSGCNCLLEASLNGHLDIVKYLPRFSLLLPPL